MPQAAKIKKTPEFFRSFLDCADRLFRRLAFRSKLLGQRLE